MSISLIYQSAWAFPPLSVIPTLSPQKIIRPLLHGASQSMAVLGQQLDFRIFSCVSHPLFIFNFPRAIFYLFLTGDIAIHFLTSHTHTYTLHSLPGLFQGCCVGVGRCCQNPKCWGASPCGHTAPKEIIGMKAPLAVVSCPALPFMSHASA